MTIRNVFNFRFHPTTRSNETTKVNYKKMLRKYIDARWNGGLVENDMLRIVNFIDQAIMNFDNETKLKDICNEVNSMMSKFPLFSV